MICSVILQINPKQLCIYNQMMLAIGYLETRVQFQSDNNSTRNISDLTVIEIPQFCGMWEFVRNACQNYLTGEN